MDKSSGIILIFFVLLITGVLIAGCSSDTSTPAATAQPSVTTPAAASSGAMYSAGDIIKNPASTSNSALLIIAYDAASDTYERAYIYPNSDGSWGYRMDSKTEKISRSIIDKVYTQKITKKTVSAVPISTPTPAVTATEVYKTATTTAAAAVAETTTSSVAPKVISIDPDEGYTGTTVSITELKGINFQSGATVRLVKTGELNISASNVVFGSSSLMTCTFAIPSNATAGTWDIVVTNPDGQYHQYLYGFTVRKSSSTTTTTTTATTTTTSTSSATITSISPPSLVTGSVETVAHLTIYGTNLGSASNFKLTSSSHTITGSTFYPSTSIEATAVCTIPAGYSDTYTVSLVDSSGTVLSSISNAFTVS
ncbi:hypothetical protein [uncultured Methanoregula sp.]|uniref:hypothetical protein n=1 Tax=uncultured Methanoregula sp. TaxID=1005933 RepID=UPI002AAA74FB|nr:hypothetical protein [uncultured Methanoregula sp.]